MPSVQNQQDKIRVSFAAQAPGFSDPRLTLSSQKYIQWIIDSLPLRPETHVLDVACGTGIMSRALAPFVRFVIGIDVTPAMLSQASALAEDEGLLNVEFRVCPAENSGFPPGTFDLSVTRFSVHHFVSDLDAEINWSGPATGLFPSRDASGELVFQQRWLMIVADKRLENVRYDK